jgi:hypothetical protein
MEYDLAQHGEWEISVIEVALFGADTRQISLGLWPIDTPAAGVAQNIKVAGKIGQGYRS